MSVFSDFATARGPAAFSDVFSLNQKDVSIRDLLESNKTEESLQAMKQIIAIMAAGGDVQSYFPSVVKQVVSNSMEVKKLVYLYLGRYAELEQDLALMSVNTFQKDLKHSNPMIRASALRVMSSIRVQLIVPLMMLAIQATVHDMSPYVRKVTALAIPKIFSLDPEQKDALIILIESLLKDKSVIVLGGAVIAFDVVCPDRYDLLHAHFRKLVQFAVDTDEWGQISLIDLLTRYGRAQFIDPNDGDEGIEDKPFYSDEEEESSADEKPPKKVMDPDHRLLLNSTRSLFYSRNSSVVMAVAKLFYYLAPYVEVMGLGKHVCRLLGKHKEITFTILANIDTMSTKRPEMFTSQVKCFFVFGTDPPDLKLKKIKLLTNLVNEGNVAMVQKELLVYAKSSDKAFSAASIKALGHCATLIPEVTESCLFSLMSLVSSPKAEVVGSSIVVIKTLLQLQTENDESVIKKLAKLYLKNKIQVPQAQAAVLWLLGEFACKCSFTREARRIATKNFVQSEYMVKLQIITLVTKMYLKNVKESEKYVSYIFTLAKFDQNYDIRDRVRFITALLFPTEENKNIKKIENIFDCHKPAPQLERNNTISKYTLASLSHLLNRSIPGYQDLPDFPLEPTDSSLRQVAVENFYGNSGFDSNGGYGPDSYVRDRQRGRTTGSSDGGFYSDDDSDSYSGLSYNSDSTGSSDSSGSFYSDDDDNDFSDSETGSESQSESNEDDGYSSSESGSDSGSGSGSGSGGGSGGGSESDSGGDESEQSSEDEGKLTKGMEAMNLICYDC